ncbi:MAG: helix-turn-helix transcriptional regulator [Umezawaea sp.]
MTAVIPKRVVNIIIGRKLEALRIACEMSQAQAGKLLDCTQNKIGNIERGDSGVKIPDLTTLLDGYGPDLATRQNLVEMARGREGRYSPKSLRARFHGTMREVVDLETSAHYQWQHTAMTIPGLLQTEAYIRQLFRSVRPSMTPDAIERETVDRMERQLVLDDPDKKFWFIIDQAAFERMANMSGSEAIRRGQKEHIAEMIDHPNLEVQVVPWEVGYYWGQESNFAIFGYKSDPQVQLVHVEGIEDGDVTSEQEEVSVYLKVWKQQIAVALGPEQSRTFLLTR